VLAAIAEENRAMVCADPAMAEVLALAERVAGSTASVLIVGESGTGKEVMARYIHARSARRTARFVAVNCAAIPEALLETELFGHEKGAFTGAVCRRIGRFEEANGGTLLLDEISEMDVRLQAKLLRAIQEREIDRVGGTKPIQVDVRLIATSNRNLEAAVVAGTFREDLYFRLNVVPVRIPPLRERPGDIAVLAEHFAKKYADVNDMPARPLSTEARRLLRAHTWPGNVRELENAMHRAILLSSGAEIGVDAFSLPVRASAPTHNLIPATAEGGGGALVGRTVAEVERELILGTLSHCLGNRTHAATILGISIRTMRNKLRQYAEEGFRVPAPGCGNPATA
jgi:two-component system response regulator FlrC